MPQLIIISTCFTFQVDVWVQNAHENIWEHCILFFSLAAIGIPYLLILKTWVWILFLHFCSARILRIMVAFLFILYKHSITSVNTINKKPYKTELDFLKRTLHLLSMQTYEITVHTSSVIYLHYVLRWHVVLFKNIIIILLITALKND